MTVRRTSITVATIAALAGALVTTSTATASTNNASARPAERWSATWASAVQQPVAANDITGSNWSINGFNHQTVRQIVRISLGGSQVRIRLSNLYGTASLPINGVTMAATRDGASVEPGSVRSVTFHGAHSTTIAAGAVATSDAVRFRVTALESLTITLYLAGRTGPATFHEDGLTTTYEAAGDHQRDAGGAAFSGATSHSFYYLTGVDVAGGPTRNVVVTYGDSITNGHNSTVGGNDRYSDALAVRLAQAHRSVGVANSGITGNELINGLPCFGDPGLERFHRDALDQPGIRTIVLLEGANDIWDSEGPYGGCGETPRVTADQLINAYTTLIHAAHARGLRVIGATITPFKAPYMSAPDFDRAEAIRDTVNNWILHSGAYDTVVDVATAVADPTDPQQINPAYNSGDFLHPNDAGYRAIADAFNLNTL
jgi:lysophospholipase L1-like esterase